MKHARIFTMATIAIAGIAIIACSDPRVSAQDCARWEPHVREVVNRTRKTALDRCTDRYKSNPKLDAPLFDVSQQWIGEANRIEQDFPGDCHARSTQTYTENEEKCFAAASTAGDLAKCNFASRFFSDVTVRLTKFDAKLESDCDGLGKLALAK